MAPSGLYARLCHAFLVYLFVSLFIYDESRTKVHNRNNCVGRRAEKDETYAGRDRV